MIEITYYRVAGKITPLNSVSRENHTHRKRSVIFPAIPVLGQLTKFKFFCVAGKITPPQNSSAIALQIHYAYTCSSQSGATCTGTGCVVYWGNSPFRTTALMRHPFFRGARMAVHMRTCQVGACAISGLKFSTCSHQVLRRLNVC